MVQQSPTKSKVLEKVAVPQSSPKQKARPGERLNRPQQRSSASERLYQKASVERSLTPESELALQAALASAKQRNFRPSRSIDLPPRIAVRHQPVNYTRQFEPRQNEFPEQLGYSKSTRVTPTALPKKPSKPRQQTHRSKSLALYALRLLIFGVGISAIAGTLLSVLDPTTRITSSGAQLAAMQATEAKQVSDVVVPASALKLNQEIMPLKTVVQQLAAKNPQLFPGMFFADLDTGAFVDVNGGLTFSAASMIKFPILVAFFQDVDAGKIRLDEKLTLKKELIGGGSGEMQYKPLGTQFTALETATKMIIISDNTATNLLIARLGGATALNQRFQNWGLTLTEIRNQLPDLPGTNTTSPKDLAHLMALVNQGDLISLKSRDRLLDIMRQTKTVTLLPRGLGQGATIAHKTGDIGSMVGDVGLVDMPSGKRYIAVAMVKRPHNDNRAQELIRQISRAAYQQFSQPAVSEVIPKKPFVTATPIRR